MTQKNILSAFSVLIFDYTFILADNEPEPSPFKVLDLAPRVRIAACDAQFIALAKELGITCITEDRSLQERFPGIALSRILFLRPPRLEPFVRRGAGIGAERFEFMVRVHEPDPNIFR